MNASAARYPSNGFALLTQHWFPSQHHELLLQPEDHACSKRLTGNTAEQAKYVQQKSSHRRVSLDQLHAILTSLGSLSTTKSTSTTTTTAATSPLLSCVKEDFTPAKVLTAELESLGCRLQAVKLDVCKALGLAGLSVKGCAPQQHKREAQQKMTKKLTNRPALRMFDWCGKSMAAIQVSI